MSADLRLALPAGAAWGAGLVLTGIPTAAGWTAAAAWLVAAALLVVLLRARRDRGRPTRAGTSRARPDRGQRDRARQDRGRATRAGTSRARRERAQRDRGQRDRGRPSRAGRVRARRVRRRLAAAVPTAALAVAALALVGTSCFALGHLRHPPALVADGPRSGVAEFVITGVPEAAPTGFFAGDTGRPMPGAATRVRVAADLVRFEGGGRMTQARAPSLVFVSVADAGGLRIGARVRASGSLVSKPPGESSEFLFFGRGDARLVEAAPWYLSWADAIRSAFRAAATGLPGDGAQLLTGLAIGDDSHVADDLKDAMIVSGLTHLTAVSGANCAVIVAAVMLVGGAVGLGRRTRVAVSIVVLGLFVAVVTPEPSVLRAATMAVIVLVALALGRPAAGIPPLCLSVIVLLGLDPWLARSAGFALSVLATAGLLLLTRPLAAAAGRILPRWLALAVAVPVAAQLACQPILFLLAPQLTPYTLPANLLAEPAAAMVSILGLIVCILAVPLPGLAAWAIWLPWAPSAWIGAVARFFASAPGAAIPVPDGVFAAATAVVLTVLALLALLGRHGHPRLARASGAVALIGVLALGATTTGGSIARARAIPPDWQLAACDIGQGDAVLVRSAGVTALVDVGPEPEPLTACLDRLHIASIDLLVLTHYDRDHVGGLDAVVGRVDRALVGPTDGTGDERMLARLRSAGAEVTAAARGVSGRLGDYRWDVLWPRAGTSARGNDASVTLLFSGPLRMLFLGDLGEQAQDAVRAATRIGPVDVTKVSHHGSADQSERLYLETHALVGIISVGTDNTYGHPTDRLLGILGRAGTRPFRTDRDGLTLVTGTAARLTVWTEDARPP